jgi:ATP-binding cassette subfamily B protein
MAGYAATTLLYAALPVLVAWLTKLLLDGLAGGGVPVRLIVALVAAGLLAGLLPHLGGYLREQLERAAGLRAQDDLYAAMERLTGLGRFENPEFQDRLRLAQQAGGVSSSRTVTDLFSIASGVITAGGYLISLSIISRELTALVLVAALPALAAEIAMSRRRATMTWGLGPVERREFFYSGLLSSVEAAKEIRLFGAGAFLRGRMLADRRTANAERRAQDRRELRVQGLLSLLSAAVAGAGLVWAVVRAYAGDFTAGDVTLLLAAMVGVQGALTGLASQIAGTHQQLILFGHYLAVTGVGPDLPIPAVPRSAPPLRSGIELRDVWFRYADDHPWILRGVDLVIPYGGTLGLVGLNGAGKSTLIKLLCRLYDPTRGSILWDGVDLRDLDPAALRRRISTVFQDFMHYDLTVTDNIAFGDDPALVREAARLAGIDDELAALPRGYDTLLTRLFKTEGDRDDPETGVLLSGGQWQRVALARALLRTGRDLLILDEPSAGLDALAEQEIHRSVTQFRRGRTAVLISHRLGTLRWADLIVVLDGGRIAESGDHAGLMARDGRYAQMFRTQAEGYTLAEERTVSP